MKITMKTLFAALLLTVSAFGQTATTSTTLSVAVTDRAQAYVVLASATNVSAGGFLYSDGEVMTVQGSYSSGTTVPVNRGGPGTRSALHLSGATVYVFAPGNQARTGLINYDLYGACVRADHTVLPRINSLTGRIFDCLGSFWYYTDSSANARYTLTIAPGAQPAATSPTAGTAIAITGQAGGAQSATTSNGAAGAAVAIVGGVGGVGGTSSGTGGAGGALTYTGGAGGGTITGGAGGAMSVVAGAGGNGTSAGGTGGALTLGSGAAGTGGTGTSGAIAIKSGATSILTTSTAGATALLSAGTAQSVTLTPSTSGTIKITGGTDPTKIVSIDASGNTAAVTETLAFGATTARTATFPDATGNVSLTKVIACGTTSTCSATDKSAVAIIHQGTVALTSASPSTVTVTGFSPAYTSTSTFSCTATPTGASAALAAAGVAVTLTSASSVTFTSQNTTATVINYICVGY